ncbi:putative ubiquinol-cytochrome C reductase complex subunit UcrQ [Microthyrium microscopicum]|uniref:Cytochrome b-c1 complex subunit 8 n=1 Tax=Microthyrium microscopicum TaxID=703497 RepID=A0A6A6U5U0_9PEZI|nr:putative ubiquinol-cytochrome C reductase complex subunit UcrQ [Microthyrium microscopicum]
MVHETQPGTYLGHEWGDLGSITKQKGITTYSLSPNRQRPFAGAARAAIFNVSRRAKNQVLYWAPPLLGMYFLLDWANKRNHYLNSKAGRLEYADEEE